MLTCRQFLGLAKRAGLMDDLQVQTAYAQAQGMAEAAVNEAEKLSCLIGSLVVQGILTCWQCEQLRIGRHKGFFAGRYKFLDRIPDKATSSYLAEDGAHGDLVQVKVVREGDHYRFTIFRDGQSAEEIIEHRDVVNDPSA